MLLKKMVLSLNHCLNKYQKDLLPVEGQDLMLYKLLLKMLLAYGYVISNVYPVMLLGIHPITGISVIDAPKEQSVSVKIVQ